VCPQAVGSTAWIDLGHAGVLDANLPAKEPDFLFESVILAGEPGAGIDAVGGPAAGCSNGVVGQEMTCRTADSTFRSYPEGRGMSGKDCLGNDMPPERCYCQ